MPEKNYLVLKELYGNPPAELGPIQEMLMPYSSEITMFWAVLWVISGSLALLHLIKELRAARKNHV